MIKQPLSLGQLKNISDWETTYKFSPPLNIEIETDARCNRECIYCPVAHNAKRVGKMDLSFFTDIINQLVEINFNGHIGFHFYNEPLLDKHLEEFIKIAHELLPKSPLYVITNGDLLTEKRAKSLTQAGLSYIRVSIHDEKIENKINTLLKTIDSNLAKRIIAYNYYKGERVMSTRAGTIQIDKEKFETMNVKGGCIWATRMVINYDGIVPLCCDDFHAHYAHGDLKKQTIKEVWENSTKRREKIFKGDYELKPCKYCLSNSED